MNATLTLQNRKTNGIKGKPRKVFRFTRFAIAAALPALALTGCYVMPVGQDASGNTVLRLLAGTGCAGAKRGRRASDRPRRSDAGSAQREALPDQ